MTAHFIPRVLPAPKGHFFLLGTRGTGKTAWCNAQFEHALKIDLLNAATLRARRLRRQGTNLLGGRAAQKHLHPYMACELGRKWWPST